MIKKAFLGMILIAIASGAQAQSVRTVLSKDGHIPRPGQTELGADFRYEEFDFREETTLSPYFRYALFKNLAVSAQAPFRTIDPELGGSESGLGDTTVGLEFLGYQDIFRYPWIMPHVSVSLATGDEDKGLGTGETAYTLGLAMGTTVEDVFHFVADARYNILDDQDNIPSVAFALVWDLDRQFSLVGELEVARDKEADTHPLTFLGGMHYKINRSLSFGVYGGTSKNTDRDVLVHGRLSALF